MTSGDFPGFDQLFQVSDPISRRAFRSDFPADIDGALATRAEALPQRRIVVNWAVGGRKPGDIIWTTSAHPLLLHERVRALLKERGCTGWRTYPVEVVGRQGERWDEYHGLAVTGRCGSTDPGRGEIVLREYPGGWFPEFLGQFFDPASWDGSDIFMEQADSHGRVTTFIFVTAKVQHAFRDSAVRNVTLTRLADVLISASVYQIGREYLLPADFKERVEKAYLVAGVPRPSGRASA